MPGAQEGYKIIVGLCLHYCLTLTQNRPPRLRRTSVSVLGLISMSALCLKSGGSSAIAKAYERVS